MTPAHYKSLTEAEWRVVPGPGPLQRTILSLNARQSGGAEGRILALLVLNTQQPAAEGGGASPAICATCEGILSQEVPAHAAADARPSPPNGEKMSRPENPALTRIVVLLASRLTFDSQQLAQPGRRARHPQRGRDASPSICPVSPASMPASDHLSQPPRRSATSTGQHRQQVPDGTQTPNALLTPRSATMNHLHRCGSRRYQLIRSAGS